MLTTRILALVMWQKFLAGCLVIVFSCSFAQAGSQRETPRIALVIGNSGYVESPLRNPANDAYAMSHTLQQFGFDVLHYQDLTEPEIRDALAGFNQRLAEGGVGLFYFAGHGMHVGEKTLLLPVEASTVSPTSLLAGSVELNEVLNSMSATRPGKLNLVILDICLNNPFDAALQSRGETFTPLPERTLVAYATAPGAYAADSKHHGVFTASLLHAMSVPHRDLIQVFQHAAQSVLEVTNKVQSPWVASSIDGSGFRFLSPSQASPVLADAAMTNTMQVYTLQSRALLPKDSAEQYELTFWESIKDSNHASDYEAYLQAYPNGRFAALAKARIARLRATEAKPTTQTEKPAPAPPSKAQPAERPRPAPAPKVTQERERPEPPAKPAPDSTEKAAAVRVRELRDCPECPVMISLPAGTFTMGSNSGDPTEKPAHTVTISAPFAIGKYEVTVEQWDACVAAGACPRVTAESSLAKDTPIRDVSWDDAQQYVKWLSKISGKSYRLPSEAEWEYAARGGTASRFWWGEQMKPGNANCKDCGQPWSQESPAKAGSFAANPYGLHDMNGSVWEWVGDCWHVSYKGAPSDGRAWDRPNCRERVIRGGSWRDGAAYMPSSTRFKYSASVRYSQNGFRVARDLQ